MNRVSKLPTNDCMLEHRFWISSGQNEKGLQDVEGVR